MFKTYQYATNEKKVTASLKHIVNVKGARGKSHRKIIGKGKSRMGKKMW